MPDAPRIRPTRLPSLTGLRFIAAFLVFVYDGGVMGLFADDAVGSRYAYWTQNLGHMGVSFFFVLSGFVLTWTATASDTARRFWRRRVVKIFPNHLLVVAIAVALLWAAGEHVRGGPTVANVFLLQDWLPKIDLVAYSANPVSWSLACEVFFYALFPLLFRWISAIRPQRLWYWFAGVVALAALIPQISFTLLPDHPDNPFGPGMSWPQMWFSHFFPPTRALEFVAGIILCRLVLEGRWVRVGMLPAVVLIALASWASLHLSPIYAFAALWPLPISLLIGAATRADAEDRATALSSRPMVWLGDISYAFYLTHLVLMFSLYAALCHGQWAGYVSFTPERWGTAKGVLFLLGVLAASIIVSALMFHFVERPMMRRWSRARATRAPVLAAAAEPVG